MALQHLDHLCLNVADMDVAKAFWAKLGFAETAPEHVEGGIRTAFMQSRGVTIDIKCPVEGAVVPSPHVDSTTAGFNHVAFAVDDIHATYHDMVEKGIEFEAAPDYKAHSGRWIAIFRDPDGNCFHISQLAEQ